MNALSTSVVNVLAGVIADVERDGSIRALLLRGEGRMFSCGGDIEEMVAAGDALSTLVDDELRVAESMIPQFASLPFPVVLRRTRRGSRRPEAVSGLPWPLTT